MDIIEQLHQEHEELAFMMDELLHLQDGERNSHDYLGSFQHIIAHEGSEEEALYTLDPLQSGAGRGGRAGAPGTFGDTEGDRGPERDHSGQRPVGRPP